MSRISVLWRVGQVTVLVVLVVVVIVLSYRVSGLGDVLAACRLGVVS